MALTLHRALNRHIGLVPEDPRTPISMLAHWATYWISARQMPHYVAHIMLRLIDGAVILTG